MVYLLLSTYKTTTWDRRTSKWYKLSSPDARQREGISLHVSNLCNNFCAHSHISFGRWPPHFYWKKLFARDLWLADKPEGRKSEQICRCTDWMISGMFNTSHRLSWSAVCLCSDSNCSPPQPISLTNLWVSKIAYYRISLLTMQRRYAKNIEKKV